MPSTRIVLTQFIQDGPLTGFHISAARKEASNAVPGIPELLEVRDHNRNEVNLDARSDLKAYLALYRYNAADNKIELVGDKLP